MSDYLLFNYCEQLIDRFQQLGAEEERKGKSNSKLSCVYNVL